MADLYADECFPRAVVDELRRLGHQVFTAFETGQAGRGLSDAAGLTFATLDGRAVLTHNRRHFVKLHRQTANHAGIIVCTRDDDAVALANRIHEAISTAQPIASQLLRIIRPSTA